MSDYFPVEQEYGYSVFSTVFHVEWNNKQLNIIDCPGADDFVGAAMTALNVTDTALLLINGQYGPEVGTQNHFRYTEKLGKPVIFLVNQLDSEKCDYHQVLDSLIGIYGPKVIPIQYPLNEGPDFNSLIDVLLMKKYSWKPEGGAPIIEDIPAEEMDKAMEMAQMMLKNAPIAISLAKQSINEGYDLKQVFRFRFLLESYCQIGKHKTLGTLISQGF